MKPKHKRLIYIIILLSFISAGSFIILTRFRDNLIYYYSPSEINQMKTSEPSRYQTLLTKEVRVGGMIKEGSVTNSGDIDYQFTVTDFAHDIIIHYTGILPPMFREGQGVVAQGALTEGNRQLSFQARNLITKHDEKYMPPEVARSLKKAP